MLKNAKLLTILSLSTVLSAPLLASDQSQLSQEELRRVRLARFASTQQTPTVMQNSLVDNGSTTTTTTISGTSEDTLLISENDEDEELLLRRRSSKGTISLGDNGSTTTTTTTENSEPLNESERLALELELEEKTRKLALELQTQEDEELAATFSDNPAPSLEEGDEKKDEQLALALEMEERKAAIDRSEKEALKLQAQEEELKKQRKHEEELSLAAALKLARESQVAPKPSISTYSSELINAVKAALKHPDYGSIALTEDNLDLLSNILQPNIKHVEGSSLSPDKLRKVLLHILNSK